MDPHGFRAEGPKKKFGPFPKKNFTICPPPLPQTQIVKFLFFWNVTGPLHVGEGGPLRVGEGGPLRVGGGPSRAGALTRRRPVTFQKKLYDLGWGEGGGAKS